jgi:chaperonin GroEL
LDNLKLEGDEKTGLEIVRRAVESPLRQLADNAGQEGALLVTELPEKDKPAPAGGPGGMGGMGGMDY